MILSKQTAPELFFNSKTFAVVGASRDSRKIGNIIFRNLLRNERIKVIPVNPAAEEIAGRKCYGDLLEIPHQLDCVIIVVKAEVVPEILRQAAIKKAKCAIIISSGFSETGNTGLELKIRRIGENLGIHILGPNVLGIINPYINLNASFFKGMPGRGKIAFLSQSGALGAALLDKAISDKIGFSGFISLGNMAMLDFSDFIEYYLKDKKTKVIALYIESLKSGMGKRFIEVCKKASKVKPIIALKAGKTEQGRRAAASHTAALASEKGVYSGIFKQAGIIEVNTARELFDVSNLLSKLDSIKRKTKLGRRACIITNAGGLGVLCADACSRNKIEIPPLPKDVKEKLNNLLPEFWSKNNPIDIMGDALAERYHKVIAVLEKENFFDFFIVLLTPQYMTQPLKTAEAITKTGKPVIAGYIGGDSLEIAKDFLKDKIPIFSDVNDLGAALGKVVG